MISNKNSTSQSKQKSKLKENKLLPNSKQHYIYNSKLYDLNLNPSNPNNNISAKDNSNSPNNTSTTNTNTITNTNNNSPSISPSQSPNLKKKGSEPVSTSSTFEQKLGVVRAKDPVAEALINSGNTSSVLDNYSNASLSAEKTVNKSMSDLRKSIVSTSKKLLTKDKDKYLKDSNKDTKDLKDTKQLLKLPPIRKQSNPQQVFTQRTDKSGQIFYQSKVERAFRLKQNTYMMNLARQHFLQCVQGIKIGKNIKLPNSPKVIQLPKKNPKFKTIFLDLDETLIHCDQASNNYTVKLNFPIQGGSVISAGIRIRPYCQQFLEQLSSFAQIIIFTASSPSYADIVLDYLDPKKKYFSHRLYRQHCTLQKGFYTKDLRIVNRRPEDIAIVDNSAFSFMTQPEYGIPILPYYHFAKDRELMVLGKFLRELVEEADMRERIRRVFYWEKYINSEEDPRVVFGKYYSSI